MYEDNYSLDSIEMEVTARDQSNISNSVQISPEAGKLSSVISVDSTEVHTEEIVLIDKIKSTNFNHQPEKEEFQHNPNPNLELTELEIQAILEKQNSRPLTQFQITKLEKEAQRNWDIFYKQNETKFFKDRQWTLREFEELKIRCEQIQQQHQQNEDSESCVTLLEIGCGVGNFVFPLLQELSKAKNDDSDNYINSPILKIYACDFSPRAIGFLKSNPEYDEKRVHGFVADITIPNCFLTVDLERNLKDELKAKIDFVSLIFVLSAISPTKHPQVVKNILDITKPGSIIFFRDYGIYDMAQLRFKPGKKIDENFYVRRDGTRSYYFTIEEVESLFTKDGHFERIQCDYVHRRTINIKEDINVGRNFVQGKFIRKT